MLPENAPSKSIKKGWFALRFSRGLPVLTKFSENFMTYVRRVEVLQPEFPFPTNHTELSHVTKCWEAVPLPLYCQDLLTRTVPAKLSTLSCSVRQASRYPYCLLS